MYQDGAISHTHLTDRVRRARGESATELNARPFNRIVYSREARRPLLENALHCRQRIQCRSLHHIQNDKSFHATTQLWRMRTPRCDGTTHTIVGCEYASASALIRCSLRCLIASSKSEDAHETEECRRQEWLGRMQWRGMGDIGTTHGGERWMWRWR